MSNRFNIQKTNDAVGSSERDNQGDQYDVEAQGGDKKAKKYSKDKFEDHKPTTYSNAQIKKLLEGYIEVPRDKWDDIPTRSHIRYIKKDGKFVRGGFVSNHWLNKEGDKFIHLANSFARKGKKPATWPMAHATVSRVFKKTGKDSGIEMDVVRTKTTEIIGQINRLVDVVKQQRVEIDKLKEDNKRIVMMLKKLIQNGKK
jgi:hypothetical protein